MNKQSDIGELSRALADRAEAFCLHFFPDGQKRGNYWQIGDVSGSKGKSLSIRINHSGGRKAGAWTDYATGEFGDLIDLLHTNQGHAQLRDTLRLCHSFLGTKPADYKETSSKRSSTSPAKDMNKRIMAARNLLKIGKPTYRTLASAYLFGRGIKRFGPALKFHPAVYIRPDDESETEEHPALLARITNNDGVTTGVARTFLNPRTKGLADFDNPKRVLGQLYGNAIRFGSGEPSEDLIVGEGLENTLSVGTALPDHDLASCLTANHLGVFDPPTHIRRLWIARDNDAAGEQAAIRLRARAEARNIECFDLIPSLNDFNDDLLKWGVLALANNLAEQMKSF